MSKLWTLTDFERWLESMAADGFTPTSPATIDQIRACLMRRGTMTPPERSPR